MGLKFRRGTTAQKSGSLAFGEPYVNTDLGTLQIGGATGDITLGASGTGSAGQFSSISGSGLDITGNANIGGDLTIGGKIQIGDNSSDTVNVVASLSSSLIPSLDNTFDLGDANHIWRDLYISTGSIKMVSNGVVVSTLSNTANGMVMDQGITSKGDSSFGTSSAAVTSVTGSLNVSGAVSIIGTLTGIGSVSGYSSSVDYRMVNLERDMFNVTASVQAINIWTSSIATTTSVTNLSSSVATTINNGSSSAYSTFAKLVGGNTFSGNQIISASVYVTGDMVVYGSSSLQNVTASVVSIGTNTVLLNTNNPAIRYGGLSVTDSGSAAGNSGSFLFDSTDNEWIFVHQGNTTVTSSTMITGPETFDNLGNETHLTDNKIPKATNGFHIVDSNISDNGSLVSINSNTEVTGSLKVKDSAGTFAIVGNGFSEIYLQSNGGMLLQAGGPGVQIKSNNLAVDGSLTVATSISSSTITGIGNVSAYSTSVASRVNTLEIAGYAVSSSVASATATSITSLSSSVKAVTDTFATSASVASATATSISTLSGSVFTTYAKLAGANTFTANQIVSGSITATGDVVAYSTSDKRHKNTIVLISDALSKVTKLNGVTWEWNDDVDAATKETPKTGLIAQEVQEVLPEVVKERGDGFLALDYSKMMGLMVEAIKEQQTQIHSLTLEIENLKKNNSL
jgi:hypothetical protein